MSGYKPIVNVPQRNFGDTLMLSALFIPFIYVALSAICASLYMRVYLDIEFALGITLQNLAHETGFFDGEQVILSCLNWTKWDHVLRQKGEIVHLVSLGSSTFASFWLAWLSTEPPPAEIKSRGRELTRDASKIQAELSKEAVCDGINLHTNIRLSTSKERQHMLLLGQPGGGKSQICLKIIEQATARGDRVMIYDYKSELTAGTSNDVGIIAPWDARSWAIDIGDMCLTKADARSLAAGLIEESSDPFWSLASRSLLVGLLCKLQVERGTDWTWTDLALLIPLDIDTLHVIIEQYNPEALPALEGGADNKTTQSIRITMSAYMSTVFDLADAWSKHPPERRISIRKWMNDCPAHYPKTLILQGNSSNEPLMMGYLQTVLRSVSQTCGEPGYATQDRRIWLFLDEFLQIGKSLKDIVYPMLEVGRGAGLRVVLAAQDYHRIVSIYSQADADGLMGLCALKIFCMTSGTSAETYSSILGDQELKVWHQTHSGATMSTGGQSTSGNKSTSYQDARRAVFAPNEFGTALGQRLIGDKWHTRALIFTGQNYVGILDWPRIEWTKKRPASIPAVIERPKPSDIYKEKGEGEGGAGGAAAAAAAAAMAKYERPVKKPKAQKHDEVAQVLEVRLPTDKPTESGIGEKISEKSLEKFAEDEYEKADYGDEPDGLDEVEPSISGVDPTGILDAVQLAHTILDIADVFSADAPLIGDTQVVHSEKTPDEKMEIARKNRKIQREHQEALQKAAEKGKGVDR